MEQIILKSVVLSSLFFVLVSTQSQGSIQNSVELSSQKNELNSFKSQEPAQGNHVSGLFNGYRTVTGTAIAPSHGSNHNQGYTYTGYTQDPNPYGGTSPPIFGISSSGDLQLAVLFGPIFWGCVAAIVVVAILVFGIKWYGGYEKLGGLVKDIGEKTGTGKSLDLDKLTTLAYQAIDKYEKWNANSRPSSVS